jgi:hypothetical protein
VLQQIQRVLQQQPQVGQLVSIGVPTVLAGAGRATVSSQSSQAPTKNLSYAYMVKFINPNKKGAPLACTSAPQNSSL